MVLVAVRENYISAFLNEEGSKYDTPLFPLNLSGSKMFPFQVSKLLSLHCHKIMSS